LSPPRQRKSVAHPPPGRQPIAGRAVALPGAPGRRARGGSLAASFGAPEVAATGAAGSARREVERQPTRGWGRIPLPRGGVQLGHERCRSEGLRPVTRLLAIAPEVIRRAPAP